MNETLVERLLACRDGDKVTVRDELTGKEFTISCRRGKHGFYMVRSWGVIKPGRSRTNKHCMLDADTVRDWAFYLRAVETETKYECEEK